MLQWNPPRVLRLAAALGGLVAVPAHADDAVCPGSAAIVPRPGAMAVSAAPALLAARPRATPFTGRRAVDDAALAGSRGGADVLNEMQLRGVVSDNQASHVSTGSNTIADGAFSGASGVPMVVQNSGNNVVIQSATIVNVQLK